MVEKIYSANHLSEVNMEERKDGNLQKFWVSFNAWIDSSGVVDEFVKAEYTGYNTWDEGYYYLDIAYDDEYKEYYGVGYPGMNGNENFSFAQIVDYIEIMYAKWIKTDKHYAYTVEVNKRFEKFNLPYRMVSGKIKNKGYKTTESIGKILNYRMFERKIQFAEENILGTEMLDKKVALDYLVDALQFFISVQNADTVEKKKGCAASLVSNDKNGKIYAVVKNELEEILKISNEFFDIRHNEYLNSAKQVRETLEDKVFIEYLYNRVYALLYLLRIRVKKEDLVIKVDD